MNVLFNIDPGLGKIAITLEDLLSAFIGALVFLAFPGVIGLLRKTEADKG